MKSPKIEPFLDDRYAPITSAIGFIQLPVSEAAEALAAWWRSIAPPVSLDALDEAFPESLCRLLPLQVGGRSRALLVDQGGWSAYFDNGAMGTDPLSAMTVLCRINHCAGAALVAIPDAPPRDGSLQFQTFSPERTQFLNYSRTLGVARENGRWRYDAFGDPEPFEAIEAEAAPGARDRLSTDTLARYAAALGFAPFDPAAYGRSILVTSTPDGTLHDISLPDRQWMLGIHPRGVCEETGSESVDEVRPTAMRPRIA